MKARTERRRNSGGKEPPDQNIPVAHHDRYLSSWDDDEIRIDVSHDLDTNQRVWSYDLRYCYISGGGKDVENSQIYAITRFPHLCYAIKFALDKILSKRNNATLGETLSTILRAILCIFSWMLRINVTQLSRLTRTDIKILSESVGKDGWWTTLEYDRALDNVAKAFSTDPKVITKLTGSTNKGRRIHRINTTALEALIGLPICAKDIPLTFRQQAAAACGRKPRDVIVKRTRQSGNTSEHSTLLYALDALSFHPVSRDSLPFTPFNVIDAEVQRVAGLRKDSRGEEGSDKSGDPRPSTANTSIPTAKLAPKTEPAHSTPNIPLPVVAKMFKQALQWIYDWKTPLLQILDLARAQLEKEVTEEYKRQYISRHILDDANEVLRQADVPIRITTFSRRNQSSDDASLVDLVTTAMFAAAFVILFSHGRRPNEVIGDNLPYGLYFGCIDSVLPEFSLQRIEIYVEKSPREYAQFWCTKLIADAVILLEELDQRFRPLFSPLNTPPPSLDLRRNQKLFRLRNFSPVPYASGQYSTFQWRGDSLLFFELAGVDPTVFEGRHIPCRRMFMSIYVRRYDMRELLALKRHLFDLRIESLRPYYRDPARRDPEDRLDNVLRAVSAEDQDIALSLRLERFAFLTELILRMLNGEPFGGAFPRIVNKIMKKLSRSVRFVQDSLEVKAENIASEVRRRGYELAEKENTNCMAGHARHTRRHSHCYSEGRIHPENGAAKKCKGCIHSFTGSTTILIFREEKQEAQSTAEDRRLPITLRKEAQNHATMLQDVIEAEEAMSEVNRQVIARMVESWSEILEDLT